MEKSVFKASLLLVKHFRDCQERDGKGFHSRVFSHFLHPELLFVGAGKSQEVIDGEPQHLEHIVPCAVLFSEVCRLLSLGMPDEEIAALLCKHWKVALISKNEAKKLDLSPAKGGLGLKNKMPDGWCFETSDTFERLRIAGVTLLPV